MSNKFFSDTQDCESFHLRVQQIFLRHADSRKLPVACPAKFSLTRRFEKASICVSSKFFSDTQDCESFHLRVRPFFLRHANLKKLPAACPANFSLTRRIEKTSSLRVQEASLNSRQANQAAGIKLNFRLRVQEASLRLRQANQPGAPAVKKRSPLVRGLLEFAKTSRVWSERFIPFHPSSKYRVCTCRCLQRPAYRPGG